MKIGITERGDASIDMSWASKLSDVDGAILITKNVSNDFIDAVLKNEDRVVLHATCTGHGGTAMEPNVPSWPTQLFQTKKLVALGFPIEKVVIRVDPVIPTSQGISTAMMVIQEAKKMGFNRFRISVIDMYPHARKRFVDAGIELPYGDNYQASDKQFTEVNNMIAFVKEMYPEIRIECCAESKLPAAIYTGCVSEYDTDLLNIPREKIVRNDDFKQRRQCCCLHGKTELLTSKHKCPNGCLYCYWRD